MEYNHNSESETHFLAPPCSAWSAIQNINDQKEVARKRKEQEPLLRFVREVCQYQIAHSRFFVIENPFTSRMWNQPHLTALSNTPGVSWGTCYMCRYGMRDPVSRKYFKKSVSLLHNFPSGCMRLLFRRCGKTYQKHPPVEGMRLSPIYI